MIFKVPSNPYHSMIPIPSPFHLSLQLCKRIGLNNWLDLIVVSSLTPLLKYFQRSQTF